TTTRRLGYGAAGAVTSDDHGDGTVYGYGYTSDNRLAQVTRNGASVASYGFNFVGQRVVKTTTSGTLHAHYDRDGVLITESNGAGVVQREYISLDGVPVGFVTDGQLTFVHADHLGTPLKITDAGG